MKIGKNVDTCFHGEDSLGPAGASTVAVIRADGALAGDAFVAAEAIAQTGAAVTHALV